MERASRWRATLVAAGAAVGLTLAGLGVAAAQTDEAPATNETEQSAPHPMGGRRGGHKGMGMGALHLHGEFTTKAPSGGYQTLATQVGVVTAVAADSVTVKSEDGFSRTYTVDDGTLVNAGNNGIADVQNGDNVRVTAVVAEGRARAVDIDDGTKVRESRGRWAPPRREKGTD